MSEKVEHAQTLTFELEERRRQTAYFDDLHPKRQRYRGVAYRFVADERTLNLAPEIREAISGYFQHHNITWHTHANHALSSQVSCLNFLAPLASDPDRLSSLIRNALGISAPEMQQVDTGPDGRPWFVSFEWNGGGTDFLNESRKGEALKRGSNSTSADAMVKFRIGGVTEILLIEWKYTEKYGAPISSDGNKTRTGRYSKIVFDPEGPIRSDLGLHLSDFFYEPFYQLLRQQMLAFQLQKARYDGANRVRVLHISPSGNRALHKVTSPKLRRFGDDAFEVFRSLLVQPKNFIDRSTEAIFRPLIESIGPNDPRAAYLTKRYRFLSDRTDVSA